VGEILDDMDAMVQTKYRKLYLVVFRCNEKISLYQGLFIFVKKKKKKKVIYKKKKKKEKTRVVYKKKKKKVNANLFANKERYTL